MPSNSRNPLVCAHYNSRYLGITLNWIYKVIINHKRFHPIFISRTKASVELFPFDDLFCLEDLGFRKYIEILFYKFFGYFYFFKRVCKQNNVSILHVHFGYQGVKMIGLRKQLDVPMVCSFYGDDAFVNQHQDKYASLFQEANRILVLGAYMKETLLKAGCPAEKLIIHHLGIDVNKIAYTQRNVSKDEPIRFLIASSFVAKKGIDLAIKALSRFKQHEFKLDIIGDGPLKKQLVELIENCDMQNHVTLHGYKPYNYFIDLAYQCHVFIQASRTTENNNKEGTPMAIVDAMATGMAVVSTKHSDIPEIVDDGETGYLANENDLDSLIDCFEMIFDKPEKIKEFSAHGRTKIENEFDAAKQTAKLEEYYLQCIDEYKLKTH